MKFRSEVRVRSKMLRYQNLINSVFVLILKLDSFHRGIELVFVFRGLQMNVRINHVKLITRFDRL